MVSGWRGAGGCWVVAGRGTGGSARRCRVPAARRPAGRGRTGHRPDVLSVVGVLAAADRRAGRRRVRVGRHRSSGRGSRWSSAAPVIAAGASPRSRGPGPGRGRRQPGGRAAGAGVTGVPPGPAGARAARARVAGARAAGAGVGGFVWAACIGVGVGGAGRAGVAGGRGDQRQGAQQQADERDRAQVVQAAAHPRRLHRPGDRGQPRHRRRRVHRRQPRPRQRRGVRSGSGYKLTFACRCASRRRCSAPSGSAAITARRSATRSCPLVCPPASGSTAAPPRGQCHHPAGRLPRR